MSSGEGQASRRSGGEGGRPRPSSHRKPEQQRPKSGNQSNERRPKNARPHQMIVDEVFAYFDGSAEPNPGRGGAGWVIKDSSRQVTLKSGGHEVILNPRRGAITPVTSNQAEYSALIKVLRECIAMRARKVHVLGDSQLVIRQMMGTFEVASPNLRPLHAEAIELAGRIPEIQYDWIPREENQEADALAARYSQGPTASTADHSLESSNRRSHHTTSTPSGRHSGSSTRKNCTDQWLAAFQQGAGNISYLTLLTTILSSLSEEQQRYPPTIRPPTMRANGGRHTSGTSTPNSSVATQSDLTESTNSFSHLEIDDFDEDDDGEADHTPTATSFPSSVQSIQVRYLLKRAQCNLAEAYRRVAGQEAHATRWNTCADNWQFSFDVLYFALLEIDPWVATLLNAELNKGQNIDLEGHDLMQLRQLRDTLLLVEHDTVRERNEAVEYMSKRLEAINRSLRPLRSDRDRVRERFGEERWRNNPEPKMTYAERIIALQNEKRLLEKAIHDVSELKLRDR